MLEKIVKSAIRFAHTARKGLFVAAKAKRALLLAVLLGLPACGGTQYNVSGEEDLTASFGVRDFRALVDQLADRMLDDPGFRSEVGVDQPNLLIDDIRNKTDEHIDTESITDSLKARMVRRRLFTIVNRSNLDVLREEVQLSEAGLSDADSSVRLGGLVGAQYVLHGNLSAIVNRQGRTRQTFYKLTLVVQDIERGVEIWIDEAEISKTSKRSLL